MSTALIAHVWQDEERDLADPVVEPLVWHAGVAADFLGYARATGSGRGTTRFLDEQLRSMKFQPDESVAFGVARIDGNPNVQIVVLANRGVQLDRTPRFAAPGSKLILEGRLGGDFEDLKLLIADGPAEVRTLELTVGPNGRFRLEVEVPKTDGSHLFEWTGEDRYRLATRLPRYRPGTGRLVAIIGQRDRPASRRGR